MRRAACRAPDEERPPDAEQAAGPSASADARPEVWGARGPGEEQKNEQVRSRVRRRVRAAVEEPAQESKLSPPHHTQSPRTCVAAHGLEVVDAAAWAHGVAGHDLLGHPAHGRRREVFGRLRCLLRSFHCLRHAYGQAIAVCAARASGGARRLRRRLARWRVAYPYGREHAVFWQYVYSLLHHRKFSLHALLLHVPRVRRLHGGVRPARVPHRVAHRQ